MYRKFLVWHQSVLQSHFLLDKTGLMINELYLSNLDKCWWKSMNNTEASSHKWRNKWLATYILSQLYIENDLPTVLSCLVMHYFKIPFWWYLLILTPLCLSTIWHNVQFSNVALPHKSLAEYYLQDKALLGQIKKNAANLKSTIWRNFAVEAQYHRTTDV